MVEQCVTFKSHQLEEIRDIVTCAICLQLYDNGCVLTCSHTYCLMCLYALCEDSSPSEYTRCPQCRKLSIPPAAMLNQLPTHQFANRLANLVREQDGVVEYDGKCFTFNFSIIELKHVIFL